MSTSQNKWQWSTTAADNDDADTGINWLEGQDPGTVNGSARAMMAAIAKATKDQGGALIAGGTSTALTVTTNTVIESANIANGLLLVVRTASAATGAATIAIDGLTAVSIKTNAGAAIASGDWASGAILVLVYSSTATAFLAANIGPATGLNINSLSALTSPDHAADYLPIYDASATTNLKILPRYLAPSIRASVAAHKNGTDQSVNSTSPVKVTFGTERFDVGSAFSSSTWTPPAGTVAIGAQVSINSATHTEGLFVRLYKNGSSYARAAFSANNYSALGEAWATGHITITDQCNGTDTYEIYVECSGDGTYTVEGTSTDTWFTGHMV